MALTTMHENKNNYSEIKDQSYRPNGISTTKKLLQCGECGQEFMHSGMLNRHLASHRERQFQCKICKKLFMRRYNVKKHAERFHKKYAEDCIEECSTNNDSKIQSTLWTIRIFTNGQQTPQDPDSCSICKICHTDFENTTDLIDHQKVHFEQMYTCNICCRIFASGFHLDKHRLQHKQRKLQCEVCLKVFGYEESLNSHMLTHLDKKKAEGEVEMESIDKRFKCIVCNVYFATNSLLDKHKAVGIHTTEKKYQCPICKIRFSEHFDLIEHINHHKRSGYYRCDICGKHFTSNDRFKSHRLTHANMARYKCDICQQVFLQLSQAKSHAIKVHQDKYGDKNLTDATSDDEYEISIIGISDSSEEESGDDTEIQSSTANINQYMEINDETMAVVYTDDQVYITDANGQNIVYEINSQPETIDDPSRNEVHMNDNTYEIIIKDSNSDVESEGIQYSEIQGHNISPDDNGVIENVKNEISVEESASLTLFDSSMVQHTDVEMNSILPDQTPITISDSHLIQTVCSANASDSIANASENSEMILTSAETGEEISVELVYVTVDDYEEST